MNTPYCIHYMQNNPEHYIYPNYSVISPQYNTIFPSNSFVQEIQLPLPYYDFTMTNYGPNTNLINYSSLPIPNPIEYEDFSQSNRCTKKISILCEFLKENLSKKPLTRNEIAKISGFSRQRISTAISVFKALGLVDEIEEDSATTKEKKGMLRYSLKSHNEYTSFNENIAVKILTARHNIEMLKQQLYMKSMILVDRAMDTHTF
eukprot:TRINITY_DN1916_c0_g1_i1.p1 TRINITY_DN1916_c0_g1~~TRINITY_DN1916_c0_g1_i1.p1  ORF type:complete len:204 (+),score=39.96 TRINITY_DN1916_c0_g1_i1:228-839(+)